MLAQKIKHFFSDEELDSSELMKDLEQKGKEKGINIGLKKRINIGLKKRINIGLKRGKEKGIEIGADKGVEAAKLILTTNKTDEEIAKETGLFVEKVKIIREKLKKN